MPRRSLVALPLFALVATGLLGAHCRSNEEKTEAPAKAPLGSSNTTATSGALPNAGITEEEAKKLLPGIDTSGLTPKQRQELHEIAADTFCQCAPTTVAGCLRSPEPCRSATRLVELSKKMLAAGQPQAHVLLRAETYFESFKKERRREVGTDGPVKGNPDAKITLVEFSDFQCPACAAVHPVLSELVQKYPDVKVVFRNFPLPQHPNAAKAAAVGEWAHEQGKFWPLADLFFKNQDSLGDEGLKRFVAAVGLDPAKALEAAQDEKYTSMVEADRAEGAALQIGGTPSIFINGRQMILPPTPEYLAWTIEDELEWMAQGGSWAGR